MSFSKPKLPLGVSSIRVDRRGKHRCVLHEPYESQEGPEECPVCLTALRQSNHYDLPCGHVICAPCARRDITQRVKSAGHAHIPFPCCLCRQDHHVCVVVVAEGENTPRGTALHCLLDAFRNLHAILTESRDGLSVVLAHERAYAQTQLCRLNPYAGWIVRGGPSIENNPALAVLYRARPPE